MGDGFSRARNRRRVLDAPFFVRVVLAGVTAAGTTAGIGFGGGCGLRTPKGDTPRVSRNATRPFAPAAISVHSLTGIAEDLSLKRPVLSVYLEPTDVFGDVVKATGLLTVLLYESDVAGLPRTVEAASSWRVDLSDPAENSRYFDPSTRLYHVRLAGVPERFLSPGRPPLLLRVKYETLDQQNREQTLRDEFLLR